MRIGLVGFFGWGNFGDELFLDIWRHALDQHELVRMNDLIEKPYFSQSAVSKAESVDAILIGGGDLIRVEAISPLYWNGAWTGKPVVVSGIGVAEESQRVRADVIPRLQKFFRSDNVLSISARDEQSAEWIKCNLKPNATVRAIPDLVFADFLENETQSEKGKSAPVVAFVLNKTQVTQADLELWDRLQTAQSKGSIVARILVLATGDQKSKEIENLRRHGLDQFIEEFDDTVQMVRRLREMDLIVSAKFHALVVASKYGIPYVSLRETSKSLALARYAPSAGIPAALDELVSMMAGKNETRLIESGASISHIRALANVEINHIIDLMNVIHQLRPQ